MKIFNYSPKDQPEHTESDNTNRSQESQVFQMVEKKTIVDDRKHSLQLKQLIFVDPSLKNPQLSASQAQQLKRNQTLDVSDVVKLNKSKLNICFFDLQNTIDKRKKDLEDIEETQKIISLNSDLQNKLTLCLDQDQDKLLYINMSRRLASIKKNLVHQRWKKVANVFLGIHRLQVNRVENIDSPQKFATNMNSIMASPHKNVPNLSVSTSLIDGFIFNVQHLPGNQNVFDDFVNEMRKCELFVMLAERGSKQDVQSMNKLIMNDPKRYVRSSKDPENILNKKNKLNQNALYIAAKNGNTEVVKFLVAMEVDVNIKSRLLDDVSESPLQVAVRWVHIECVEILLKSQTYQQCELRECQQTSKNKLIKTLLTSYIKKGCFCNISCFQ